MSGRIPTDPAAREALAGEYVLGIVDARTAAEVARTLAADADLRRSVEAWEDRLTALADAVPQEAPPPDLWLRIERRLPGQAAVPAVKVAGERRPWFWRAWAIGASVAAVAFAGIALMQSRTPAPLEASALPPTPADPAGSMRSPSPETRFAVEPKADPTAGTVRSATAPGDTPAVRPAASEAAPARTAPIAPGIAPPGIAAPGIAPPGASPAAGLVPVPTTPIVRPAGADGGTGSVRPSSAGDGPAAIIR